MSSLNREAIEVLRQSKYRRKAEEAIRFRMEQLGLDRKDLEPLIGSRARVSEVLNKRRGLSLKMIRALHEELDIPLEALIGRDA